MKDPLHSLLAFFRKASSDSGFLVQLMQFCGWQDVQGAQCRGVGLQLGVRYEF